MRLSTKANLDDFVRSQLPVGTDGRPPLELKAHVHFRHFELLARVNVNSLEDVEFVRTNAKELRTAWKGLEEESPQELVREEHLPPTPPVEEDAPRGRAPPTRRSSCKGCKKPVGTMHTTLLQENDEPPAWLAAYHKGQVEQRARQTKATLLHGDNRTPSGADSSSTLLASCSVPLLHVPLQQQHDLKISAVQGVLLNTMRRLRKAWKRAEDKCAGERTAAVLPARGPRTTQTNQCVQKMLPTGVAGASVPGHIACVPDWLLPRPDRKYGCVVGSMLRSGAPAQRNKIELHVGWHGEARATLGFRSAAGGCKTSAKTAKSGTSFAYPLVEPFDTPQTDSSVCGVSKGSLSNLYPASFAFLVSKFQTFLRENGFSGVPWRGLVIRGSVRTGEHLVVLKAETTKLAESEIDPKLRICALTSEEWQQQTSEVIKVFRDAERELMAEIDPKIRICCVLLEDVCAEGGGGARGKEKPKLQHLFGDGGGYYTEELLGIRLRISANAFFQTDTAAAEALYGLIAACAVKRDAARACVEWSSSAGVLP